MTDKVVEMGKRVAITITEKTEAQFQYIGEGGDYGNLHAYFCVLPNEKGFGFGVGTCWTEARYHAHQDALKNGWAEMYHPDATGETYARNQERRFLHDMLHDAYRLGKFLEDNELVRKSVGKGRKMKSPQKTAQRIIKELLAGKSD